MKLSQPILLLLGSLMLAGCYVPRSIDSYNSTFHLSPKAPNQADPYTFGGMADGSGGTISRTSYSTDSKSVDPRSATETGKSAMTDDQRIPIAEPRSVLNVTVKLPIGTAPAPKNEAQKGETQQPQPVRG